MYPNAFSYLFKVLKPIIRILFRQQTYFSIETFRYYYACSTEDTYLNLLLEIPDWK